MASADLRKDLECCICLDFYTDPVTLNCGHSFCRECINDALDTQEESGSYSCPECRENFKKRPALQKNFTLCKLLETLQATLGERNKTGISCTYCIHTTVPAVKSCLMCEAYLCDNHLRVHSKAPEHVLCDPTTSPQNRKCSVHKKILEYYCTEDSACICMSCRLDGEHLGHQVETLEEASEKKKKELRNVLQKLMTEREKMEKRVQSLEERRRKLQAQADEETERVAALFSDLRRRLEDLEKKVLREVSRQEEWALRSLSHVLQKLEIKKDELYSKMFYIEELCNMRDPLTVLQESDIGDLCDTEDGHDEDTHDDGGGLDVESVSHTLCTGLHDIMSGVNVQKRQGTHASPHSSTEGKAHTTAKPSRPRPPSTPTVHHSYHQAGGANIRSEEQTSGVSHTLHTGLSDIMSGANVQKRPGTHASPHSSTEGKAHTIAKPSRPCPPSTPTVQHSYHQAGGANIRSEEQTSGLSHTLHTGLSDIMPGANVQIRPGTHASPHSSTEGKAYTIAKPSRPHTKPHSSVESLLSQLKVSYIGAEQQMLRLSGVMDILLDINTAGNRLHISDDRKMGTCSSYQNRSETPERFQGPQVLSSQSFSSGLYWWEVDVGGSMFWRVGMCYPSIERRGDQAKIGDNKKSWCLKRRLWYDQYSVIHDKKKVSLPRDINSNRVRILLDYEAGQISFFDLCDPVRHLYTFTTKFTEPLHAAVWVGEGCIKICGDDQIF